MDVADRAGRSLAETLAERRREVHALRLRSLAESNPQVIADVIGKWLAQDPHEWLVRTDRRPAFLFPK